MELRRAFAERFGTPARVFRSPGRINLIGEHTDYNEGFVLPAAIDLCTRTAAAPRPDRQLVVYSRTLSEEVVLNPDDPALIPTGVWSDYVLGVARILSHSGYDVGGANLMIDGNVPLGAGLSSSASLEVSVALALLAVSGRMASPLDVARMAQRAEHEYAGTRCGLMDQFSVCFGESDCALLLDCRSLEFHRVRLPLETRLVVANTMVKRELANGQYNLRRSDCEEAARLLGVKSLRDITPADFRRRGAELTSERIRRRVRHVVTENARTVEAAQALGAGELTRVGQLMSASHASLRNDFEVSCPELDAMVTAAQTVEGVYGSRMMGGGFGGCTITLTRADAAEDVMREIAIRYHCLVRAKETRSSTAKRSNRES